MSFLQVPCAMCLALLCEGDVEFREETRRNETSWAEMSSRGRHPLCPPCYQWLANLLTSAAASGDGAPSGARTEIVAPGDTCNFCRSTLDDRSYIAEMVPALQAMVQRRIVHRRGRLQQYRLCLGCWTWCRALVFDDSAARWRDLRKDIPVVPVPRVAAGAVALAKDDTATLAATLGRADGMVVPLCGRSALVADVNVTFVATGVGGRATAMVQRIAAGMKPLPCVAVARLDALDDLAGALKAGAIDFVTAPLTEDQVLGCLNRLAIREVGQGFDEATGLPLLSNSPSRVRFGRPCHMFRVACPPAARLETAWLLRRFLRGYDRVGADEDGNVLAAVYCPANAAPRVLARLRVLLEDRATVTHVAAAGPVPGTAEAALAQAS